MIKCLHALNFGSQLSEKNLLKAQKSEENGRFMKIFLGHVPLFFACVLPSNHVLPKRDVGQSLQLSSEKRPFS